MLSVFFCMDLSSLQVYMFLWMTIIVTNWWTVDLTWHFIVFDKGERLHSAVALENFAAFIDTDLALPKNSSGAKLFRENDVIFIGHVLNLVLRLSLLCLLNEVAMCFVSTRSPVSICLASWCASLFSLTFSSRLMCFLVEFWTLLPCLFYMFTITIA